MEVVAPSDVTPAPFALCPSFQLLAVGIASSPASAETVASRVDVLRLLRPTGDEDLGRELQVDCFVRAPGLRRVAWSSTPTSDGGSGSGGGDQDDDTASMRPVEQVIYPAGLLAGGFNDGAVRIWNPRRAMLCDMKKSSAPKKPVPVIMMNKDPKISKREEEYIPTAVSKMYSEMGTICWACEGKDYFQTEEQEFTGKCQVVEDDPEWQLISKEEPVANQQDTTEMELLTEMHSLHGPVLGLSFSEVYPYWMASSAFGERISIDDLHHPFQLSKKKRELPETGSEVISQTTCLKWSKTYPCILASTSDIGVTKIWDVRCPKSIAAFSTQGNRICSSDLEFSLNNPMHLAVSSAKSGSSAAVKIWDLRGYREPCHQYGASGVLSLSWNTHGQLLASHKNGRMSCYNPYQDKILDEMDFVDCNLGLTWTHSDDTVATFSSTSGVQLSEIGWLLQDRL